MIEIKKAPENIELKCFGKGAARYSRSFRLSLANHDNAPVLVFDTADDEYGRGMISLEELKVIIDEALDNNKPAKDDLVLIGYLNQPIGIQGLPTPIATGIGDEVYKARDKFYVKKGSIFFHISESSLKGIYTAI